MSTTNNIAHSTNDRIAVAWDYHNATKHSYLSLRQNPHHLDESKRPFPFKIYPASRSDNSQLDPTIRATGVAALSAISENMVGGAHAVLDLETVAQLLFLSAGVTRQRGTSAHPIYYRAAPCTGALYEIELYLVCRNLAGCQAGVFHFSPIDGVLHILRAGNFRQVVVEASANEPAISSAPIVIICTCTYWRNAWRYHERTYRHFGWDCGTLIANLLAACASHKLPAKIVCGFIDTEINHLLGVDPEQEVAFSLVAVGHEDEPSAESRQALSQIMPLGLRTAAPSHCELNYPVMRRMHMASSLHSSEEVRAWRTRMIGPNMPTPLDCTFDLRPLGPDHIPQESVEQVILRRGSCRKFSREPISVESLSTILHRTTRGVPADFVRLPGAQLNQLYLIVNAVDGLLSGAYVFHRDRNALELLRRGEYRDHAGRVALHQEQAADAAVNIFLMADLSVVLQQFGNRGYRAVHLEAGIIGGKLYLGAYAQSLSATGLTFVDDAVTEFFSPHAYGKSAIFLVALGKGQKAGANTNCAEEVSNDVPEVCKIRSRILLPGRPADTDADESARIRA